MDLLKGLQVIFGGDSSVSKKGNMQKDESLHHHENELYKKNIKLREQLDDARERIVQLENQIFCMKEENTKVEKNLDSKRDELDRMIAGVTARIQEMTVSLEERMEKLEMSVTERIAQLGADAGEQIGQIRADVEPVGEIRNAAGGIAGIQSSLEQLSEMKSMLQQLEKQKISVETLNEAAEDLKTGIVEKIHAENVKCYRNMKSLVTDLEVKMEQMELGEESLSKIRKSFKGIKFFSFFAFVDCVAIIIYILYSMGVF